MQDTAHPFQRRGHKLNDKPVQSLTIFTTPTSISQAVSQSSSTSVWLWLANSIVLFLSHSTQISSLFSLTPYLSRPFNGLLRISIDGSSIIALAIPKLCLIWNVHDIADGSNCYIPYNWSYLSVVRNEPLDVSTSYTIITTETSHFFSFFFYLFLSF